MARSVVVGRRVAHGKKCGYEHGREVWTGRGGGVMGRIVDGGTQ